VRLYRIALRRRYLRAYPPADVVFFNGVGLL